jgi:hypothetical protein
MFLVYGKRPSALELIIPGSIMTVINPNKQTLPKLSVDRARTCNFLTYGNHVKMHIYWDQKTMNYKRSYHSVIDMTALHLSILILCTNLFLSCSILKLHSPKTDPSLFHSSSTPPSQAPHSNMPSRIYLPLVG